MQAKFVHLRVHTEFSLVDGIVRVKPLVKRVRELGMPAVAVTDHCNLFALVKFYRAAQSAGIKPIIGADVCVRRTEVSLPPFRMTLLVVWSKYSNALNHKRLQVIESIDFCFMCSVQSWGIEATINGRRFEWTGHICWPT